MTVDVIMDLLRASLEEQVPIKIFFKGNHLKGTVRQIDEHAVEIESHESRSAIRLLNIDAVTLLPHSDLTPRQDGQWAREMQD